jgi:hypothetical protein
MSYSEEMGDERPGWNHAGQYDYLSAIRSSLADTHYKNGKLVSDHGGDIEVMKQLERIISEAIIYWTR